VDPLRGQRGDSRNCRLGYEQGGEEQAVRVCKLLWGRALSWRRSSFVFRLGRTPRMRFPSSFKFFYTIVSWLLYPSSGSPQVGSLYPKTQITWSYPRKAVVWTFCTVPSDGDIPLILSSFQGRNGEEFSHHSVLHTCICNTRFLWCVCVVLMLLILGPLISEKLDFNSWISDGQLSVAPDLKEKWRIYLRPSLRIKIWKDRFRIIPLNKKDV
jgi:hypothetical protein